MILESFEDFFLPLEGAATTAINLVRADGSTDVLNAESAELPTSTEEYWFEAEQSIAQSEGNELDAIIQPAAAIDLDFDPLVEFRHPTLESITFSAPHQLKE